MRIKKVFKIGCLSFLLCIAILCSYLFLPTFHYKKTLILGETVLTKEKLIAMAKVDFDKNIFLIPIKQAQENIEQDPLIKEIHISRRFPWTLIFSVSDRIETGAVSFDGGFAIIDEEGYVMKIIQNVSEVKKPIIAGIKTKKIQLGEKIPIENEDQFSMVLGLIAGVQNAKLMDVISQVNMENPEDVKMTTLNGLTVLLGEGKEMNYKMLVLNQILLDLHSRNITHGIVDMRFDSYPVYREG